MVHYANPILCGLDKVQSLGDGQSINLTWFQAYPDNFKNKIAYHIYYSTVRDNVFSEGVKFVIIDGSLTANIIDLTPGQDYWFSLRPVEYNPAIITFLSDLPIAHDNVRFYPSSMLRQDMSATDVVVPLLDVEGFSSSGVIRIGVELIQYLAVDPVNKNLIAGSGTSGVPAHLVLQPNSQYYLPSPSNTGNGTLNSLVLVGVSPPAETWKVECIATPIDGYGNHLPAIFEAIGSVSGERLDGYGNDIIWHADGNVVSNDILSFSITQTTPDFQVGDFFTIQVAGPTPGTTGGRGFNGTPITIHTVSGFDGYTTWNPIISEYAISEDDRWDNIYACQARFEYPNYPFTVVDGYHQVLKDVLSTDLSAADAANVSFPMFDFAGFHRTDPVQLLNGTCVGSYIGGEMGCIDKFGNFNILRGFSLQDQNTQRQDILLSVTGRPAVLLRRRWEGVTSNTYLPSNEYPDDRGLDNYGGKFVLGYDQYFNPRRSDGRILVRVGPTAENLRMHEPGLESEFPLDMWTLTVPTIKTRDVLVLFDQDNNEEFRYEVSDVIRNNTILGLDGGQHLKTFRIRKFDPAYQIRVFRDTSDFPTKMNTTLGFAPGLPPHSHEIVRNEHDPSTWSQTTQVSQGHNHAVIVENGILTVMPILGHSHQIII